MNWVTTNIRIPEDVYMDLKMSAAQQRTSVAAVIRQKLVDKPQSKKIQDIFAEMDALGKKLAKQHPGFNSTKAIHEMRYEQ